MVAWVVLSPIPVLFPDMASIRIAFPAGPEGVAFSA
jgi:hypothetical protein